MNVNFYMLDPVPKLEVVKLLSIADLSLSLFGPIKEMWNNSANKFFDALASNTPVAINYCGWQEELINSSGCGIVLNSSDYKSSVLTINEFLFNDQKYSDAKAACLELANDKFSRDNIAEKIINTLHDAANA